MTAKAPHQRWSARSASFAISLGWHILILATLALAVHPLPLPRDGPPIEIELLPPLVEPEPPKPKPPPPVLRKLTEVERPPKAVPLPSVLPKATEVKQKTLPVLRKLTDTLKPPELAPAPLDRTQALQPALAKPLEVQKRTSSIPLRSLDRPAAPQIVPEQAQAAPVPAPPQVAPAPASTPTPAATPAPVQVLTNQNVIQAPVAIRPPDRTTFGSRTTTPNLPPPDLVQGGEGAPPGGGTGGGGGGGAGGGAPGVVNGRITGFDAEGFHGGLRMRLGCATPETYKLSPEDKAACLARLAEEAKVARAMGPNIPLDKQAQYDRQQACHARTEQDGTPTSTAQSEDGSKTLGLGDPPRLRDCGPGDR